MPQYNFAFGPSTHPSTKANPGLEEATVAMCKNEVFSEERLKRVLPEEETAWIKNPKKIYRLLYALLGLTLLSLIFSIVAVAHCTFLIYIPNVIVNPERKQGWGLYSEGYFEDGQFRGCLSYNDTVQFSGAFMAARVFGVLTAIAVSISFLFTSSYILCMPVERRQFARMMHLIVRCINPFACLFAGFMFSVYTKAECDKEEARCYPGAAGIIGALNIPIILAMSVIGFIVPLAPTPVFSKTLPIWSQKRADQRISERPRRDSTSRRDDERVPSSIITTSSVDHDDVESLSQPEADNNSHRQNQNRTPPHSPTKSPRRHKKSPTSSSPRVEVRGIVAQQSPMKSPRRSAPISPTKSPRTSANINSPRKTPSTSSSSPRKSPRSSTKDSGSRMKRPPTIQLDSV